MRAADEEVSGSSPTITLFLLSADRPWIFPKLFNNPQGFEKLDLGFSGMLNRLSWSRLTREGFLSGNPLSVASGYLTAADRSRRTPISAAKFPKWVLFKNRFRWNFAERFLGSKQSNVATHFFGIRPTSGLMGNFRFRLVFQISRYTIDQSKLGIAQIEA